MPSFEYDGFNAAGKRIRGSHQSLSKQAAIQDLRTKGFMIRSIRERKASVLHAEIAFGRLVKPEHFVVFCRQFATLVRAGIQIDQSLAILVEQTKAKRLRAGLEGVLEQVREGYPLSKAMGDHPKLFPDMFVNMIASGESSGQLDDVLDRMAQTYEKENATVQKIKSAMTYPIILLIVAFCVVVFLLLKIVPTFVGIFRDQGSELPLLTRMIMGASDFVVRFWWLLPIVLCGAALLVRTALADDRGRFAWDKLKLGLPIFGIVFRKAAIARMARTMSSLYASGVPIIQSLDITAKVVGNRVLAKVLTESKASLQQGRLLSEPFKASRLFPAMVIQMIVVGEETGQLDRMLGKIADFFEEDVDRSVDRLQAVVEPLMLLFISGIVGIIVAAVMTPMFGMYENFLK